MQRTHLRVALLSLAMPRLTGSLFMAGTAHGRHPIRRIGYGNFLPLRTIRIQQAFSCFPQIS